MPMKDQRFSKSSDGTLQDGPRRVQLQEAAQPAGVGDGVRRKRRRTDALFGGGSFFRSGFAADAEFFFGDAEKPVIPRLGDAPIVQERVEPGLSEPLQTVGLCSGVDVRQAPGSGKGSFGSLRQRKPGRLEDPGKDIQAFRFGVRRIRIAD